MRKVFCVLCFSMAVLSLPFWVQKRNGAFRLVKVDIDLPFNPAWESDPPSEALHRLLSRPFFYIGRGAQAFVFESEDHSLVLKLFRGSPKLHPAMRFWRHTLRKKRVRSLVEKKIPPLFSACHLAYREVRALTGLCTMHLNQTRDVLPHTTLLNRMGKKIAIDLNQCRFVLQKKGVPIQDAFRNARKENDHPKFIRLAQSFVTMLQERVSKNISNSDKTLWYNSGFVEETAIEWDFGRYGLNPKLTNPSEKEKEMRSFTDPLQQFLQNLAPDWPVNLEAFF
jgi:hypothetical protein